MAKANIFRIVSLFSLLLVGVVGIKAQKLSSSDKLYQEIQKQDSLLFTAFNNHDVKAIEALLDKNLEFYHDKGGLTDYQTNIENFKKAFAKTTDLNRQLVAGSLEVYPVKDYGAMQIGTHTFCHTENGRQDCGTFKFAHIWKKTAEGWKLTRVLSYGH